MSSSEEDYFHWISLAILCLCEDFMLTPAEMVFSTQVPAEEGAEELPTTRTHHALAGPAASSRRARVVPREASCRCRLDHDRPLYRVLFQVSLPQSNSCSAYPRVDRR